MLLNLTASTVARLIISLIFQKRLTEATCTPKKTTFGVDYVSDNGKKEAQEK